MGKPNSVRNVRIRSWRKAAPGTTRVAVASRFAINGRPVLTSGSDVVANSILVRLPVGSHEVAVTYDDNSSGTSQLCITQRTVEVAKAPGVLEVNVYVPINVP